jgi:plasmid stabilization system protein ParE
MRKIVYDAEARLDLYETWLHIARDNLSAADKYIDGLNELTRQAATHPFSGYSEVTIAQQLGKDPELIRSLRYCNHRLFYYLRSEHEVYVFAYIHGKQDRNKALRERLRRMLA